jgi:alpha-tubulin suppressor-like RCC1 family protein
MEVPGFKDRLISISTGNNHIMALDCRKRVYSWGINTYGQLGHGMGENITVPSNKTNPTLIKYFQNTKVISIFSGHDCSFAVASTG